MQPVYAALTVLAALWAGSGASPLFACDKDGENHFVADDRSLCMFYQCAFGVAQKVACAKGSRVPSYYTKGQSDPCIVKVKKNALATCDRCNVTDDPIPTPNKTNQCAQFRPCDARPGCTCVDQVSGYYCNCSLNTVAVPVPMPTPALTPVQQCDINVCQNNGTCYSLYKNKFCNCKPPYTGKYCEYNACKYLSCGIHGHCVHDDHSVYCECDRCYTGPCCENKTENCIPCPNCFGGATCDSLQVFRCECNPCNKTELCFDNINYFTPRECTPAPDTAGNEFTLMFTDNVGDDPHALEIYVSAASADNAKRYIQVDAPLMKISYSKVVQPNEVGKFQVDIGLLHRLSGKQNFGIRVIEVNGSLVNVYCINRAIFSADGWLALPDKVAGRAFLVITYSPVTNAGEFAFVAIKNGTQVTIKLADNSASVGPKGTVLLVNLDAWQTYQVQSARPQPTQLLIQDFTGTSLVSNNPIHVYSGEARAWVGPSPSNLYYNTSLNIVRSNPNNRSRDILVLECTSADTWGKNYALVPLPRTSIDYAYTEEYIKLVSYARATCTLYTTTGTLTHTDLIINVQDNNDSNRYYTQFPVDAAYNYFLACDIPVMLVEITESSIPFANEFNDPSFIYVPAVSSYANNYHFSPPEYSGGANPIPRPYLYTYARLIAKESEYTNILINEVRLSNTTLETLKNWTAIYVPPGNDHLYGCIIRISSSNSTSIRIPGTIPGTEPRFAAIVEGFDNRESYGIVLGASVKAQNSSTFNIGTFQLLGNVQPIVV